jgi:hypothetical protein
MTVTKNGAVIDTKDISGGLEIEANNVTVKRTRVRCGDGNCITIHNDKTGTVIQDTEVGGGANGTTDTGVGVGIVVAANGTKSASTTRIDRVNVHHTTDGLRSDGNLTVTNSYIHDPDPAPGLHGDGSQTTGWSNMVFRNNVIIGGLNSAIFLNQESPNPSISNVVVDGNLLEGTKKNAQDFTSFPLYVNGGCSNVTVTNNAFNRIGYAAALDDSGGSAIVAWSNNVYADNGEAVAKPGGR